MTTKSGSAELGDSDGLAESVKMALLPARCFRCDLNFFLIAFWRHGYQGKSISMIS